jgi:hypothetical protein
MMVQPNTRRHREEREKLARNQKGKILGRWKRLETFHPLTCIK